MNTARGRLLAVAIAGLLVSLAVALRSPSADPSPSTSPAAATGAPALPTVALGTLQVWTRPFSDRTGDWAFFIQTDFGPGEERTDRLIGVRLADGASFSPLESSCGSARCASALTTRLLDEQFSPDGRRLVLSVAEPVASEQRTTLVIVELATGVVRLLTSDRRYNDVAPRWSPDGTRIAFVRSEIGGGEAGIFVVEPSGAGLRQVLPGAQPPSNTLLYGWTADSTGLGFSQGFEDADYKVVEVARGRVSGFKGWTSGMGTEDWRTAGPAFVAVFGGAKGGDHTVEVAGGPGEPQRVLATQPGPNAFFIEPRWRPGGDEIAVVNTTYRQERPESRLLVVDALGRSQPRAVASHPDQMRARWTPDGTELVFLEVTESFAAVGMVRADGTDDRLIFHSGGSRKDGRRYGDLTVVRLR